MSSSSDNDIIKVVILGDVSDKTELLHKFVSNKFQKTHLKAIGIEPYSRYQTIDGRKLLFSIWDITHHDRFKPMRGMLYRNSFGALVVFDVTQPVTFLNVDSWIHELKIESPNACLILVGLRDTSVHTRKVTVEQIQAKLEELEAITYIETSIQSGEHIEDTFTLLGKRFLKDLKGYANK